MIILGIETSCDETAVSVCKNGEILSNIISSQEIHNKFGGVVPEIASREHEKVLNILHTELDMTMALCGHRNLKEVDKNILKIQSNR